MGSGVNSSAQGKYTGNDVKVEIKPGFKPKVVKIRSVEGEVVLHAQMPGALLSLDTAVPAHLAEADMKLTEFGFEVNGAILGVNSDGVDYFYEAY